MFVDSNFNNICQLLTHRELGRRVSFENYIDQLVIKNIKENAYSETNFVNNDVILAIDVQDYLVVTANLDHTIKLWNLETGKCQWTFDPKPQVRWSQMIKIVEGNIICTGEEVNNIKNRTIRIIHLKTGIQTASITNSKIGLEVCPMGQEIFVSYQKKKSIVKWNTSGKFEGVVAKKIQSHAYKILGSEKILTCFFYNTVMVFNLYTKNMIKMEFNLENQHTTKISSLCIIPGNILLCGFNTNTKDKVPDCCLIDLDKGNCEQYQLPGVFNDSEIEDSIVQSYPFGYGVSKVKGNKDWVFLGHSKGKVVALNLNNKQATLLGQHSNSVTYLELEGKILISGSEHKLNTSAELVFWDIQSMTMLMRKELPSLKSIFFTTGKVLCAINNLLVQWNFLNSQKEQKNTTVFEVPTEIEDERHEIQ